LNIVRFANDHRVSGKGAKIFFADPSIYSALTGHVGNIREALVVTLLRQAGKKVYACKKEQDGDFVIGTTLIEIGGANKKPKKSDFVIRDELDLPGAKSLPLWSLGMLY
jgi:predicted AAA+ superfamily ATPase